MNNIKIDFKAGKIRNCFRITPNIQITHHEGVKSFSIEFTWAIYGFGWIFYKEIEL